MRLQTYKNNSTFDYDDISAIIVDGCLVTVVFKSGAVVETSGFQYLATNFRKYMESKIEKEKDSIDNHPSDID